LDIGRWPSATLWRSLVGTESGQDRLTRRAMRWRESHTEVIAMFGVETNKAIALRLVEVFNGRRLDLLEDVLHPEFRGRGISAFALDGPEVGPGARRRPYGMFLQASPDARCQGPGLDAQ